MTPDIPIEQFEIFATGIDHPECVAFDRHGDLWCGGEAGQIYRISLEGKSQLVANVGGFNAGLAFSLRDELFVCNPAQGILRIAPTGEYTIFATHAGSHKIVCPNYGLFDSKGNYYVTDSGNWKKNNGYLLRFPSASDRNPETAPAGEIVGGPVGYANGLALSADEKSLYMVESNADRVLRFVIAEDGTVSAPEVFAEGCGRFPDGLVLDADGNLYACCYASDEIWKISQGGAKSLFAWDRWAIHLGSPTNMAFGGANLDELYVANLARTTITRARLGIKGQPLANQRVKKLLRPRPAPL